MIFVFDAAIEDPEPHRAAALRMPFGDLQDGEAVFHGIARAGDNGPLQQFLRQTFPGVVPTLSYFRRMPLDQPEPTFVHSDPMLGDWAAVLFLTPAPPPQDGTVFWRHTPTGRTRGPWEPDVARDLSNWHEWSRVGALFNRLVVFPSDLYHSRAMAENYGTGDDARLIQVVFGTGRLQLTATNAEHVIALPSPAVVH